MVQQKQWVDTVFNMANNSIEFGTKTLDSLSQQAKESFDITVNGVNALQNENRKMVDNFVGSCKNFNKMFSDAYREGLGFIQQQYTNQQTPKK